MRTVSLMSDYNATIVAIDSGIECFERIQEESSQYHRIVCYDLSQLESAISEKIRYVRSRIETINAQINAMYSHNEGSNNNSNNNNSGKIRSLQDEVLLLHSKLDALETIKRRCQSLSSRFHSQSRHILGVISENASEGIQSMAAYLRKIQSIDSFSIGINTTSDVFVNPFSGEADYAVVIVDSLSYPETAEHINTAIRCGAPSSLTLDRRGADDNRIESLRTVPIRESYDRDEYPMACFEEGGLGAHVFYLSPSDNRGAGSSISHQLRNIPDGTRVRFRVI